MPTVRAFFTNMSVPMPLGRKLKLVFRNNFIKIWRRQNCCGHPGEPGCCEGSSDKHHSHARHGIPHHRKPPSAYVFGRRGNNYQ